MHERKKQILPQGDSGSGVVKDNKIYGVHVAGGDYPCVETAAAMRVCVHLDWILRTAK